MYIRILSLLLATILIFSGLIAFERMSAFTPSAPIDRTDRSAYWLNVVLIPLDSRPPCTQFVQDLGRLAGVNIILPEQELLDQYKVPGNTHALRNWLKAQSQKADAAIISVDMLIHGGLLASRLSQGSLEDVQTVSNLLSTIHQDNPQIRLYAFTIIPRLLIADNQNTAAYQKSMGEYSLLKDKIYTFENPFDIKKMRDFEQTLPPELVERYFRLYEENTKLNEALMAMVEEGILSGLVIGQDDGQLFGIPNIKKQYLEEYANQHPVNKQKTIITRGTDEVALTLLGRLICDFTSFHPKIFVAYSDQEAPHVIMPYMPHSVSKTVEEKVRLVGGIQVYKPENADFILFVHVGTAELNDVRLSNEVYRLNQWLSTGYKVALVDLTENFNVKDALLPLLLKENIPITQLVAYAGWNTTSNSIGTAITQAYLFTSSLKSAHEYPALLSLYQENVEFLIARMLDDLYYQKEIYPQLNKQLRQVKINPYEIGDYYSHISKKINRLLEDKASRLAMQGLYTRPFVIKTKEKDHKILISRLKIESTLPWQRTFEIRLKTAVSLLEVSD